MTPPRSRQGSRIKVLFPIYGLKGGGAERIMITLVNHLDHDRFESVLVLIISEGEYLKEVRPDVRVIRLFEGLENGHGSHEPVKRKAPGAAVRLIRKGQKGLAWGMQRVKELQSIPAVCAKPWALRSVEEKDTLTNVRKAGTYLQPYFERVLEQEQPAAMVAHLLLANTLALRTGPDRGIFTAVCMHNTLMDYQTREEYNKSPLQRADAIVTVSQAIGRIFQKKFGRDKVRVLYNPHDIRRIQALAREPVLHPWFVQKELPLIVAMGRLSRQKNFLLLVEAVCALNRSGRLPVRLALFGEGPERDRLMRSIRKNGQQERIRLMGWTANPFRYLAGADLFVLSSNWEGLPNTLIEAMACGVPVISTDCESGPAEILEGGACGRLVPPGDAGALAEAIVEVLTDEATRKALAERGEKRAWAFDVSEQVPAYENLILHGTRKAAQQA